MSSPARGPIGVRGWRLPALVLAGLLALACGGDGGSGGSSPVAPAPTPALPEARVQELLGERSIGSAGAPVTMIEYSSLTCPHCASFHVETLPRIRSAYVESGRVRFVYRDFPLDNASLDAAVLARCAGEARYFEALDILYARQSSWRNAAEPRTAMKGLLAPLGLATSDMDACLATAALRNGILQVRQEGQAQHGISGTPSFLVNGRKLVGALPFAEFQAAIDEAAK